MPPKSLAKAKKPAKALALKEMAAKEAIAKLAKGKCATLGKGCSKKNGSASAASASASTPSSVTPSLATCAEPTVRATSKGMHSHLFHLLPLTALAGHVMPTPPVAHQDSSPEVIDTAAELATLRGEYFNLCIHPIVLFSFFQLSLLRHTRKYSSK